MSFRVKDFWKNVVAEFETQEDLINYISSSEYTSSLSFNEESSSLNYFQYDEGIHESLISGGLLESSKEIIRITYVPGQDDDILIDIEPTTEETGSIE